MLTLLCRFSARQQAVSVYGGGCVSPCSATQAVCRATLLTLLDVRDLQEGPNPRQWRGSQLHYAEVTIGLMLCCHIWGCSSDGRASALHAEGNGIDAHLLHGGLQCCVAFA